jgi:hypothetical protein
MNYENTRRGDNAAPPRVLSRSDLQKQVSELAAQRAAISEVLRAIASSPHDLQPIFETILTFRGSILDADPPTQGVKIARRITFGPSVGRLRLFSSRSASFEMR